MKTCKNEIVLLSLFDWALILASCDQSRWLKPYTLNEIGQLIWQHRNSIFAQQTEDGRPAGFAIAYEVDDGETLHIAFIVAFSVATMPAFCELLRAKFPNVTKISYLRRNRLAYTKVSNLDRMLRIARSSYTTLNTEHN